MPRVVLAGILVTLVPVAAFLALDEASVLDDKLHRSFDPLRAASLALEDRTGGDCAVVTSFSPQAGWYSQCESVGFSRGEASNRGEFERSFRDRVVRAFPGLTSDVPVFLLLADEGKRQPTGEELSWLHDMTGPTIIEIGSPDDGRLQHVEVFDMGTLADFRARGADGG